jgi:anti-anti-sigma factor
MRHRLRGVTVITIGGELDLVTAGELESFVRWAHRPGDQVVLDLTGVGFLDCSGLRALLRVHHEVSRNGGVCRLAAPQPIACRVLKITGVDRCMPVHASRAKAVDTALTAWEPPG